ncbi:hypothetical protein BDW22DRAFT_1349532, partial [Trametopsis cervina]
MSPLLVIVSPRSELLEGSGFAMEGFRAVYRCYIARIGVSTEHSDRYSSCTNMPAPKIIWNKDQLAVLHQVKADLARTEPTARAQRGDLKTKAIAKMIELSPDLSPLESTQLQMRVTHWINNHCNTGLTRQSKVARVDGRASKWTTIWARENPEVIKEWLSSNPEGDYIGRWQGAVAELTKEVPPEEVARLKKIAQDEKQGNGISEKLQESNREALRDFGQSMTKKLYTTYGVSRFFALLGYRNKEGKMVMDTWDFSNENDPRIVNLETSDAQSL